MLVSAFAGRELILAAGGVPVIPGFAATSGAQSYPVLWGVASGQGINPSALPAGGSATGKIYFDVTGGAPNSVPQPWHHLASSLFCCPQYAQCFITPPRCL